MERDKVLLSRMENNVNLLSYFCKIGGTFSPRKFAYIMLGHDICFIDVMTYLPCGGNANCLENSLTKITAKYNTTHAF